jgi:hypothetical protein
MRIRTAVGAILPFLIIGIFRTIGGRTAGSQNLESAGK